MKYALLTTVLALASLVFALDGQIGIHDPSTVVRCNGKFYTYGTGGTSLVSDDGWTWRRGATLPRRGLAPDVIHIGDRYYVYVAANIGAQPKAAINMISSKTLDPDSPDYKWEEGGVVASSDGVEDSMPSTRASFWIPATAGCGWSTARISATSGWSNSIPRRASASTERQARDLAINCEASDMIYHDGWYYLLATHGSCCRGADSGYNIRVGRAKNVTGPFLDNEGIDMIQGGGKLFAGSGGRVVAPAISVSSISATACRSSPSTYEADLDRGGASVLDIRPLLWKDGWPVAGENMKEGTLRSNPCAPVRRSSWPWKVCRSAAGAAMGAGEECSPARARRFRRRMSPKSQRTGPRATSRSAWRITCARPSRSGR